MPQKVHVRTLGCRLNQGESDAIERRAITAGFELADRSENADIVVINTCAITHAADGDSRKAIREVQRDTTAEHVIVTGCYASSEPEQIAQMPGVESVVHNRDKDSIFADTLPITDTLVPIDSLIQQSESKESPRRSRAYLKVQDGCDYKCSFCIVPSLRGASLSIPIDDLVSQLRTLIEQGQREIVLTGVHLGTYGRDLQPRRCLSDLLLRLLPELGEARLRLGSLDPHEVSDTLIDLMAQNSHKLCRHLHLPIQSGDPEILRRMRRAHTVGDLKNVVRKLKERIPDICIGSDVIVGFPGETEEAFQNTLDLLQHSAIDYFHVFSYSRRTGTTAADMADTVSPREKKRRSAVLRELSDLKRAIFAYRFVGRELPAFVQLRRSNKSGDLVGLTDNYLRVPFSGADTMKRSWTSLRIIAADELRGELH